MLDAVLTSMSEVWVIELTQVPAALVLRSVGGVLTKSVPGPALAASWSAWSVAPLMFCMN